MNPEKSTVLITGANSGLGLELSRQYAAAGWNTIATTLFPEGHDARTALLEIQANHPNLVIEQIDVTNTAMIRGVAEKYQGQPIDVVINNAAKVEASFEADLASVLEPYDKVDFDKSNLHFEVNAIGPMRMAQAFMPHVKKSALKRYVCVTSFIGSFGYQAPNSMGYNYGASKAALNMYGFKLAAAMKPENVIVALVEPVLIQTKPGVEKSRVESSPVDVEAGKLINLINNMTMEEHSGVITNFTTGKRDPF